MKQIVAATELESSHTEPTDIEWLLVEVTHSQKLSQVEVCCLERVEIDIVLNKK